MECTECGKHYEGTFCTDCYFQCIKCGEILDKVIFESIESLGFCYECIEDRSEKKESALSR